MRKFHYSFLRKDLFPIDLLNITNSISELRALASTRKNIHKDIILKLMSVAKVQSAKGSNTIEGIVTIDKRLAIVHDKK